MIAGESKASNRFELPEASVTLSPVERFSEYLRSQGKRFTSQRRRILETVYNHHEHFDAEELFEQIREGMSYGEVSRPTIYRTLSELVDAGILRRMQVTLQGRRVYECQYAYPLHDHLLCEQCNRLIEFHSEEFERIANLVAESHRFEMHGHCLVVAGLCEQCCAEKQ